MAEQLAPMPSDWSRALVVVAHPDDIEYGMSGAVAVWTEAGRSVTYVIVSSGEAGIAGLSPDRAGPIREQEQRTSAQLVGVDVVDFLGYADGIIDEGKELRRDITRAIRRHRPELVLTINHRDYWDGHRWNTPDHRAVGRSVLDATADAGNEWLFRSLADEGLRPWNGVRWVGINGSPVPTHAVDVTGTLDRAIASLAAHATYVAALTDEDPHSYATTFVTGVTAAAGRFGSSHAVAFELIER
ncbi:MAG TPA: PIG-L deacetylase family protein [Pseudonocardiaceae bacterium]|jgi:LmbE family N-acetylglucosaminyl deacetylase|nr:PIG-L deacetylase family protein [Pseudonocardiaceae bacterium]